MLPPIDSDDSRDRKTRREAETTSENKTRLEDKPPLSDTLMARMKRVDPGLMKRYHQKSGE